MKLLHTYTLYPQHLWSVQGNSKSLKLEKNLFPVACVPLFIGLIDFLRWPPMVRIWVKRYASMSSPPLLSLSCSLCKWFRVKWCTPQNNLLNIWTVQPHCKSKCCNKNPYPPLQNDLTNSFFGPPFGALCIHVYYNSLSEKSIHSWTFVISLVEYHNSWEFSP